MGGFCTRCGRDRFSRTGTRDLEWCTGEGAADHVRNALQLLQIARFRSTPDTEHVEAILDHQAYIAALERLIQAIALLERKGAPPAFPSSGAAAAALFDEAAELERAPRPRIPHVTRTTPPLPPPAWPLALARLLFGTPLLTSVRPPCRGMLSF